MRVTDPQAIKALAHPVRLGLPELLATISPATAAQCGRILGGPRATGSFHRHLRAKWLALMEPYLRRDDHPRPDRRHVRYFFAATPLGEPR